MENRRGNCSFNQPEIYVSLKNVEFELKELKIMKKMMGQLRKRFLIILCSLLVGILLISYLTGILGVIVEELIWRLSNIYWKPL